MLTLEQEVWLAHLHDSGSVRIIPFDPTAQEKFEKLKKRIHLALGENIPVEHRGATSLGISGQDEIDTYIPVAAKDFVSLIAPLAQLFGEPRSIADMERVRFVTTIDGKHVDVFLVNQEHLSWKNGMVFDSYLRAHPETLREYAALKEAGRGLTTRAYYRQKLEFINAILEKV